MIGIFLFIILCFMAYLNGDSSGMLMIFKVIGIGALILGVLMLIAYAPWLLIFIIIAIIILYYIYESSKQNTIHQQTISNLNNTGVTTKTNKNIIKKILAIVMIVGIIVTIPIVKIINIETIKRNIRNELTMIAESKGLKDIEIMIGEKMLDHDLYKITIKCSNLQDLSFDEMYALENSISSINNVGSTTYKVNGIVYNIYPSMYSIYKNGEQIHYNYQNSQSNTEQINKNKSKSKINSNIKKESSSYRKKALTYEEANALHGTGYHNTRPNSSAESIEIAAETVKCIKCGYHSDNGRGSLCDYCK